MDDRPLAIFCPFGWLRLSQSAPTVERGKTKALGREERVEGVHGETASLTAYKQNISSLKVERWHCMHLVPSSRVVPRVEVLPTLVVHVVVRFR